MRESTRFIPHAVLFSLVFILGCSSSNNLRKFDEGDLSKEISSDAGKKFEVKDQADPSLVATPVPVAVNVKKKKKKKGNKVTTVSEAPLQPAPELPPLRRVDPAPFDIGEKLEYDIRYVGVTAGYFNIEILPHKFLGDRKVYHILAKARTVKLFELVYRVDDSIESFFDYEGLYSHKFTMDLNESKQTRKLIELYDYDAKKSFYWNRVDHVQKGFKEEKTSFDIPLWSQDLLSSIFFLRMQKLGQDPSQEFRFPVILDGKPWEARVRFKNRTKIYAGGKEREADLYQLDTYQNGELKNKDNSIWFSTDEKHYLLRVEAKVKVGSFAIALDKIQ